VVSHSKRNERVLNGARSAKNHAIRIGSDVSGPPAIQTRFTDLQFMHEHTLMSEKTPKQVLDSLTKKSAIVIALCASPLYFLFAYLGDEGKGRAAALCVFVILTCAKIFWSLRKHVLYWLSLTILTACHVPLILLIPWTSNSYPGIVLLPFVLPDFAIMYGALKLVEKTTERNRDVARNNINT
jgi:hypothetical protein